MAPRVPTMCSFPPYFEREVLRKRPYLRKEWCIAVIEHPLAIEQQEEDDRVRFWDGYQSLMGGS